MSTPMPWLLPLVVVELVGLTVTAWLCWSTGRPAPQPPDRLTDEEMAEHFDPHTTNEGAR